MAALDIVDQVVTHRTNVSQQDMQSHDHNKDSSSACYQVATPKSPHDLIILSDEEQDSYGTTDSATLHFDTTKSEILDIINLQTLITGKDITKLEDEIQKIDAQIAVLEHMHSDKLLLEKVDKHLEEKKEVSRRILEAQTLQNTWQQRISFAPTAQGINGNDYNGFGGTIHIPKHHYQTRSKSHGNLLEAPLFHPEDDSILNERTSKKQKSALGKTPPTMTPSHSTGFEIHKFQPNQMNTHHRRVYSSSCLSNNSGVVGHTETNKPIFRRYDGILVVIKCSF